MKHFVIMKYINKVQTEKLREEEGKSREGGNCIRKQVKPKNLTIQLSH